MLNKAITLQPFLRLAVIVMTAGALIAACAPGISPEQVQLQVQTGVAETVQAQNNMATAVALTVTAGAPTVTPTSSPTEIPLDIPTLTPVVVIETVTPFVASSGGGGGGSSGKVPDYACSFTEVKPLINVFKPTDYIDVVWIITNTGLKTWPSALDLDFENGTRFSPYTGEQLPALKSGERVTISFEGNAPSEPGYYEMKFKVQGGLCFPFIDIQVIKPPGS